MRLACVAAFAALTLCAQTEAPRTAEPPRTWVDTATGHRVVRLTDEPGSASLYFNQNWFTPDGTKLVYTSPTGIYTLDLATHASKRVVEGRVRLVEAGKKTPSVFYIKTGAIYYTNTESGATREVAKLPPNGSVATINADETLIAGTFTEAAGPSNNAYSTPGQQAQNLNQPANKGQMMEERLAAHIPMGMFVIDTRTGESKTILRSTDWLNHLLFSPTDPTLLMFCHEGPWHKVERIWTIRTDGSQVTPSASQLTKVHTRTMEMEIFGHEFWSIDGKTIYYDLQIPVPLAAQRVVHPLQREC
jgi:oligogalacturonide lyase